MRNSFLVVSALIGVFCFAGSMNAAHSKSVALQKAQADRAAADLARQERDRVAAQEALEREKVAQEKAAQEARERERVAAEKAARERVRANIEMVLREDARIPGGARNVAEIATRMRDIDLSGCPEDFRLAYLDHIHAWETMRDVERDAIALRKEANSDGVMVESFIRGMLGDPFGKANEISAAQSQILRDYKAARSEIKETFDRVEDIAVRNAANLPTQR
jgi:hypothetical protein